jgi:FixJ family two-component response regulator
MHKDPCLIAIIDDEESVRKALGRLICAAGFAVQAHSSGAEFLNTLQRCLPQCVLLDVRMPHLDGFEVQQALHRIDARVPVLFITSDDSAESRARAFRQGAQAYLRKPIDDALLIDAIQTALRLDLH